MDDYQKLQKFVEAALTNPKHPVYQLGMQRSPILQHYAINVSLLQSVKAEEWFKQYPEHTAKLTEVMALCEAGDDGETTPDPLKAVKDELEAAKSEIAALKAQLAQPKDAPESVEA